MFPGPLKPPADGRLKPEPPDLGEGLLIPHHTHTRARAHVHAEAHTQPCSPSSAVVDLAAIVASDVKNVRWTGQVMAVVAQLQLPGKWGPRACVRVCVRTCPLFKAKAAARVGSRADINGGD